MKTRALSDGRQAVTLGEIGVAAGLPTLTGQQIERLSGFRPVARDKAANLYLRSAILTRIGEHLITTAKTLS